MNTQYLYSSNKTSPDIGTVMHTCKPSNRAVGLDTGTRKKPSNTPLLLPGQLRPALPTHCLNQVLPTFTLQFTQQPGVVSTAAPSCALEIQGPSSWWFRATLHFLWLLRTLSCYSNELQWCWATRPRLCRQHTCSSAHTPHQEGTGIPAHLALSPFQPQHCWLYSCSHRQNRTLSQHKEWLFSPLFTLLSQTSSHYTPWTEVFL